MLRLKLILMLLMMLSLMACDGVPRPGGLVCIAHLAGGDVSVNYSHCYDMKADFDDRGKLIPGHHGQDIPLVMNKHVHLDAQSFANLTGYMQKVRARLEKCEAGQ